MTLQLASPEVEPLLGPILEQLGAVVAYDGASIMLVEDSTLRIIAYRGPIPQEEALRLHFPLDSSGANQVVVEQRRPVLIPDVRSQDDELARAFQKSAGPELDSTFAYVRSWLGVPLIAGDTVLGMLSLDSGQANFYDERDSRLVLAFARQVAATLENAQLYAQSERRMEALQALYRADEELYSHLELDKVLQSLVDVAVEELHADKSSIIVWDEGQHQLVVRAARGFHQETLQQMVFAPGEGIIGQVATTGEPMVVEDVAADINHLRWVTDAEQIKSFMHLPLRLNGEIFGVFNVDFVEQRSLGSEEQRLFAALAQRAALAIENARLYRAAEQRADEAQTLFAVQQAITGRLDREAILQLISDEARRLTGASRTIVFDLKDQELEIAVISGDEDPDLLGYRMALDDSLTGIALRQGQPFRSDNAPADERLHQEIIRRSGVRSLLTVPMLSGDQPLGAIAVANKDEGVFTQEDIRVLQMLASSAVVALENARLYEREQARRREAERRRQVAEGLRDILTVLNSNLPLTETLQRIVAQASRLLGADAGLICRLQADLRTADIEATFGLPPEFAEFTSLPVLETPANLATLRGETFSLSNMHQHSPAVQHDIPVLKRWRNAVRRNYAAFFSVPLLVGGEVYGDISLYYRQARTFSPEERDLAIAFADQAALAIENARLRVRVEESAAAEERNRLARELHDAVTQTLFSASLIAEVLPRIWERNQEMARARLEELRELTRGALAEMRTLLLELRPATLTESSLPELLRQLQEAFIGRSRLDVNLEVSGQTDLPPQVQVVFYRIAQESLNNVAKHAEATRVDIKLHCDPQTVTLSVADDGRGFHFDNVNPDSLGLSIMRERVQSIGARLKLETAPGEGTVVTAVWPVSASIHKQQ